MGFYLQMKTVSGCDVRAGLKPLAQNMEALRAEERVEFIRLSRTEAGIYPADLGDEKRFRNVMSARPFLILRSILHRAKL